MADTNSNKSGLYILKSTDNFFMVKVEADSDDDSATIKVVPATFNNQDNFNALINDDSIMSLPFGSECLKISNFEGNRPILSTLDYFQNCSLGDIMSRKTGTHHMVCAILSFCAELFGHTFTKFGVQDAATFWCGKKLVASMWLHNLLVYGETYYERKFGAKPEAGEGELSAWTSTKTRLATEKVKRDLIDSLIRQTTHDLGDETPLANDLCAIMENCVGNCTWNEMFHELHFAHDGKGCQLFSMGNLRRIKQYFDIQRIDKFQIELDATHKASLVAHEKILDGEESSLVTLEQLKIHRENKNV